MVVNWNRKELLRACLASLARQKNVDFETIVVDNGSSDGSAEMAEREFGARVIRNAENRGFCAANNQGIAAARGEFIALLNNDAEAEPGLARRTACAPARRGPRHRHGGEQSAGLGRPAAHRQGGPPDVSRRPESRPRQRARSTAGQFDREEEVLWPDGCAAMYRKPMLDEIGGFDEDFFAYGDDAELGPARAHRGMALPVCAARGGAAPSRLDVGQGFRAAPAADRAQSRAAGGEAVPVEPAVR